RKRSRMHATRRERLRGASAGPAGAAPWCRRPLRRPSVGGRLQLETTNLRLVVQLVEGGRDDLPHALPGEREALPDLLQRTLVGAVQAEPHAEHLALPGREPVQQTVQAI